MRELARGLAALGAGPGVRVLVGLSNRPETVPLQLALQRVGAVHVPLLGGLTFEELAFQMEHSEAGILIADDPVAATLLARRDEWPRELRTALGAPGLASLAVAEGPDPPDPPGLRRGLDRRDPLHVGQHRPAQGRRAAERLVLQLRRGLRRPLRRRPGRQRLPAHAAGPRRRRPDRPVDGAARRVPPDGGRPLQPGRVLGPGGRERGDGRDPLPRPPQPAARGGVRRAGRRARRRCGWSSPTPGTRPSASASAWSWRSSGA